MKSSFSRARGRRKRGSDLSSGESRGVVVDFVGFGKEYGDFTAVEKLDLSIHEGEVFGFLGPNGAGKTTTIKVLTGILEPSRGRLEIFGMDPRENSRQCKMSMGYIPDSPFLYDKLTGDEYLAFVSGLWGVPRELALERAAPFLSSFKLQSSRGDLVEGYSHGMKQKLVMIAAMLHHPRLLIVDEPTVGLDPRSVLIMKDIFRGMAKEGRSVFLSTHSLDVAENVCDRIGILHRGSLVALGTMAQLREEAMSDGGNLESIFLRLTEEEEG